ncbi:hypothetical protein CPZ30_13445 [Paenibacillus lautus]|nr:hypothetical protein [Paenibacillus lautus]PCL92780.1 hypothetical protein CPZ30_13445 [Paenibacillus lautus]
MLLVDKIELKKLTDNLGRIKKAEERINSIVNSYDTRGGAFHKLFLHSGFLMSMEPDDIDELLRRLSLDKEKNIEYLDSLDFINYLLKRKRYYDDKLKDIFIKNSTHISVETLFKYVENIKENMLKGLSMDGEPYPSFIIESQFSHILDSMSEIISFIRTNNVTLQDVRKTKRQIEITHEIIKIVSHSSSIRSHLLSMMMELSKAKKVPDYNYKGKTFDFIYMSLHNIPYWSQFEIYRDLNFALYKNHLEDEEQLRLMKDIGFVKKFSQELIHIDWSKNYEYYSSETINSSVKLLQPMYGDLEDSFLVGEEKFSIKMLVEVLQKLFEFQFKKNDLLEESASEIFAYGEKALIRAVGLSKKDVNLLRLLAFDLYDVKQKEHLISYKPLIRSGKLYYIIPSHFNNVSIEKCIDKIVSSEVKIQTNNDGKKGYKFEATIETFFHEMNIEFARVERDERKGIPEFDGIFILDDYVFYYDAKASIKPENIVEAYNNLQTVVAKGYIQLIERTKALIDNEKRRIIEEKTKLDLKNKKLAPFILSNHFYFNGYRNLTFFENNREVQVPIIDFSTFQKIISTKKFPIWNYDNKINKYRYNQQGYQSAEELYGYLCNQIRGLGTEDSPTYQITEDFIAFKIVKPISIAE